MSDNGPLWDAEEALLETLADCPTFREMTSTVTHAQARAKTYHNGLPAPTSGGVYTVAELEALRPYGIAFTAPERGLVLQSDAVGIGPEFLDSGSLILRLVRDCPDGLDDEPTSDANQSWEIAIGKILLELCALSGRSDIRPYLGFREIRIDDGPYWPHRNRVPTEGLWQGVEIGIEWGSVG